jgi:hypothetical protein
LKFPFVLCVQNLHHELCPYFTRMDTIRNADAAIAVPCQSETVGLHPRNMNSPQSTASYAALDDTAIAFHFTR